ncbi:MAG: hypothetical protein IJT34_05645, partial [Butyrivibrio sp.]|nr:hypothetical protein [Butyrivibrio sp.]
MAQTADTRAVGRILHILLPLVALILPVLLLSLSSPSLNTPRSYYYTTLYDGWTVEMNGVTETEVDVTTSHIRWRNKGDTAVMRHALPVLDDTGAPLSIIAPCVMFPTSLSTVRASVGDEEIYAYGQELADAGLMVPRHVHFIPLDGTSPGSELVLTITSTESGSLLTLPRIFFGNREDLRRSFIEERRLPLFVGGFLVTFAFVLLILSSYLYLYHGHDLSLLPCAAISFVLGIYIQSYNDVFGYLTDNDRLFTDAEYFSLYMTPLTLVAFICVDRRELLKEKFSRITILFFLVANALFPAVALVCHLLNIIHLNRFLPGLHIMAVVEWLVLVPMLVFRFLSRIRGYRQEVRMETRKQDSPTGYARFASDNSLLVGLVIFMVCAG